MLCDTIMIDMFIYTFVQIHRMDSTKSEPEVNYELWVWLWCVSVGSFLVTNVTLW